MANNDPETWLPADAEAWIILGGSFPLSFRFGPFSVKEVGTILEKLMDNPAKHHCAHVVFNCGRNDESMFEMNADLVSEAQKAQQSVDAKK